MTRRQKMAFKSIGRSSRSTKWSQFGGFGGALWLKAVWGVTAVVDFWSLCFTGLIAIGRGGGFWGRAWGFHGDGVASHTCAQVVNGAFREADQQRPVQRFSNIILFFIKALIM